MEQYDFSGWATRNDLVCGDGRTIRKNAFKHCDGKKVPLVYNHSHGELENVLGHAILENRDEGVYAYCKFNDTEKGKIGKQVVQHGDIEGLSIYANKLKHMGSDVVHGDIKELSLVLAGSNPGAYIDFVMAHGEDGEDEDALYANYDERSICIYHSDNKETEKENKPVAETANANTNSEKTVADVFNSLTEEQKNVVYAIIGQALEDNDNDKEGDDDEMKHNVFDGDSRETQNVLSHSDMKAIVSDAKRSGSLKDAFLAHADYAEGDQDYGIIGTDWLFPEDKLLNSPPEFIKRETGWVSKVMSAVHHTPFSRIKSMFADITEDEARAKGYMKGKLKKEEVFSLLKRSTTPTTIYKKQKLDRDDVSDITDFDVVAWIKREMRLMLDEEIARAILVGDGRLMSSDDKINEQNIRPVWKDEELFTIKATVTTPEGGEKAKEFIKTIIKSRKNYKGSGEPTLYTTEDMLTDCLLLEDKNGRIIYDSLDKLKSILRVKEIVTVPVMEGLTREGDQGRMNLLGLVVNLKDYNVGADKGGAINMFDDFDIDFNAQKYLIETRCSGALIKPYSAIAVEEVAGA